MTPKFTTSCYVRVKDADKRKEICEQLERIGYKLLFSARHGHCGDIISVQRCGSVIATEVLSSDDLESSHDCGTNTELFLALASMRSDTDKGQWFVVDELISIGTQVLGIGTIFNLAEDKFDHSIKAHRATAAEIIEHFNNK